MILTAQNVETILFACLRSKKTKESIYVQGAFYYFDFDARAIKFYEQEIFEMLKQLPYGFMKSTTPLGDSFLSACINNKGHQWREQLDVEQLLALGLAIQKIRFAFPRSHWETFPGGLPYFLIEDL